MPVFCTHSLELNILRNLMVRIRDNHFSLVWNVHSSVIELCISDSHLPHTRFRNHPSLQAVKLCTTFHPQWKECDDCLTPAGWSTRYFARGLSCWVPVQVKRPDRNSQTITIGMSPVVNIIRTSHSSFGMHTCTTDDVFDNIRYTSSEEGH